ncbi:hypothetical protein [Cellvibrio sp.]|uniref:hypothetical protein n=1 Tax=Cellvibrio sp. TaxID=1965322 RepID=UPI0039648701
MEKFTDRPIASETKTQSKHSIYAHENSHIKGWGIDANRNNDPTFPMRQRTNETTKNYYWDRPPLQPATTEILQSIERPNLTATFGTAAPPSGVSGKIRRFAFKYSEGKLIHWLALLLADRVNVVEALVTDITNGNKPNLLKEYGTGAQWKHKPEAVITKVVMGATVLTCLVLLYKSRKRQGV